MPAIDPDLPIANAQGGPRVAIVGRPNVGKSTLINRLLGEDRLVVSDVAGTTRDSISVTLERDGKQYTLVDTAGVRRRARVEEAVEKFSVIKTLQSIAAANVVVVLLDAREGVSEQDATVIGHVLDEKRALVIAVNKWDGLSTYEREQCKSSLSRKLDFVAYARVVTISALHGSGIAELMRAIDRAYSSTTREFGSAELTRALEKAYESLSAAAHSRTRAEAAFRAPGWNESADHRDPRQPHEKRRRRLSTLSREFFPQTFQARRHADPHRISRKRKSIRRPQERIDGTPGKETPPPDPEGEASTDLA